MLRRQKKVAIWHDRAIEPGAEWESEIDHRIDAADLILLLMSPSFIHSDYCFGKELRVALHRHQAGEARIIPIILRPCEWQETDLARIQALPRDGTPISRWPDPDDAWFDVTRGVRRVVEALLEGHAIQDVELLPDTQAPNQSPEPSPIISLSDNVSAMARRLRVEWSTEHASDRLNLEGAKLLLARSSDELMGIRTSPDVDRRPFLHRSMDSVLTEMKRLERHRTWADEFHYNEFWWLGNETIERLEAIGWALHRMAENGVDPINGADLHRLLGAKACLRLAADPENPIRGRFRNTHLLVELPLSNEGKVPARDVTLLSVNSELDDNTAHIENVVRVIPPGQEQSLFFIYRPTYVGESKRAQESRFRLRIGFQDEIGQDTIGYAILVQDSGDRTFRGKVIRERTVASPLCRGLVPETSPEESR